MKCRECRYMEIEMVKCGRNQFYCLPHGIIAGSRETEIPTKTAPRWCPLKGEAK